MSASSDPERRRGDVVRHATTTVGYVFVSAGSVVLGTAIFPDWTLGRWESASARLLDTLSVLIVVLACGPVWSLVLLAGPGRRGRRWWRTGPVVAAVMATVAATAVVIALANQYPEYGLSPAGPIAAISGTVLVAGWVLVAIGRWRSVDGPVPARTTGWAVAAGLAVLALIAAGSVPAVRWYIEDRFVDHSAAAAPAPAGAFTDPGRRLWHHTVPAPSWLAVSAHHVVMRQRDGVRGLDPATGRERWRFLHRHARTSAATLSADGSTVVALFGQAGGYHLGVGLDEATGAVRWQRRYRRLVGRDVTAAAAGDVVLLTTVAKNIAFESARRSPPVAIDVRTGALRWRASGAAPGCDPQGSEAVRDTLVVWFNCYQRQPSSTVAVGLSAVDGATGWIWEHRESDGYQDYWTHLLDTGPVLLGASAAGKDGRPGPLTDYGLDPDTGTELWRGSQPAGYPVAVRGIVLYLGPADLVTAVDPRTGKVQWSQRVPALAGRAVADARADDGRVVAVLREATDTRYPPSRLRLITLEPDSRTVTRDAELPHPPVPCRTLLDDEPARWGYSLARRLPCTGETVKLAADRRLTVAAAIHSEDVRVADLTAWG